MTETHGIGPEILESFGPVPYINFLKIIQKFLWKKDSPDTKLFMDPEWEFERFRVPIPEVLSKRGVDASPDLGSTLSTIVSSEQPRVCSLLVSLRPFSLLLPNPLNRLLCRRCVVLLRGSLPEVCI